MEPVLHWPITPRHENKKEGGKEGRREIGMLCTWPCGQGDRESLGEVEGGDT